MGENAASAFIGRRVQLTLYDSTEVKGIIEAVDVSNGALTVKNGTNVRRYNRDELRGLALLPDEKPQRSNGHSSAAHAQASNRTADEAGAPTALPQPKPAVEAYSYQHLSGQKESLQKAAYRKNAPVRNEWADEDMAAVLSSEEFDFARNLSQFDKKKVYDEIRAEESKSQTSPLLVEINKKSNVDADKMRSLRADEMVLSPSAEKPSLHPESAPSARDASGNYQKQLVSHSIQTTNDRKLQSLFDMARSEFDLSREVLLECAARNFATLITETIGKKHTHQFDVLFLVDADVHGAVALNTCRHLSNIKRRVALYLTDQAREQHRSALKSCHRPGVQMIDKDYMQDASITALVVSGDNVDWTRQIGRPLAAIGYEASDYEEPYLPRTFVLSNAPLNDYNADFSGLDSELFTRVRTLVTLGLAGVEQTRKNYAATIAIDLGIPLKCYSQGGVSVPSWNQRGYQAF